MSKHAYLIVANGNFTVVETCLRMIDDERNDVYLLLDKKTKLSKEQEARLCDCLTHARYHLSRMVVNWGGWSQIAAVLKLLHLALDSGNTYDYLHFLQGSDLPIRGQNEIHAFFDAHAGTEFVQIEKGRTAMAERKAWYRHFFCHNRFFRKNKLIKACNFGVMELQKLLHIRKNKDIALYQGSALFSITGECAKYVLSREKEIRKRFRLSLAADEVFLQSILMASEYRDRICDVALDISENARLIDRTRPDGKNSPHVWRKEELTTLLNAPATKMFARKFDERIDANIVSDVCKEVCCHE